MSMATARRSRAPAAAATTTTTTTGPVTRQAGRRLQPPASAGSNRRGGDGGGSVDEATQACPICFDELVKSKPGGRLLRSSWAVEHVVWLDCGHAFCLPCIAQYASTAVREGKTAAAVATGGGRPLECPVHGCKVQVSEATLKQLLSPQDWAKHVQFLRDAEVAADPRLRHCPKQHCTGVARLSPASLALLNANAAIAAASSTGSRFRLRGGGCTEFVEATCQECLHSFCAQCAADAHPGVTCSDAGDAGFFRWAKRKPVKPCPKCSYQIEKRGGCSHMHCAICRTHWCWNCSQRIGNCRCYAHFINPYQPPGFAGNQPQGAAGGLQAFFTTPVGSVLGILLSMMLAVGVGAGLAWISLALPGTFFPLFVVCGLTTIGAIFFTAAA